MHSLSKILLAPLLMSLANAHAQGTTAPVDVSYTLSSANGNYIGHALSSNVPFGSLPLSMSIDLSQGKVAETEVMNMYDLGLRWDVTKLWTLKTHVSNLKDETFVIYGKGLSVAANLHTLWKGKRSTRVQWGVDQNDYAASSGNAIVSNNLPNQRRITFELRQGIGDDFSVFASTEQYDYDRDPSALAAVLLSRRVRKINAGLAMGSLLQRANTYGVNWHMQDKWALDLSYAENWSVLQQRGYSTSAAVNYDFSRKGTLALGLSETKTSSLLRPNGTVLSGEQINSTLEVGIHWSFD